MKSRYTRREWLKGTLGALVLGATSGGLAGCGTGGATAPTGQGPDTAPGAVGDAAATAPIASKAAARSTASGQAATASAALSQREVRASANGLLDTRLTTRVAQNVVGGRTLTTRTFEGTIGAPTLRVKPGDTLRVTLDNQLPPNPDGNAPPANMMLPHHPNSVNLHTHGLHVSPQSPADNVFLEIFPGEFTGYEYKIPANHPAGTHWYHPHKHGSVSTQLFSGMAGALIVEGDLDEVAEIKAARDVVFLVNELNVGTDGQVPAWNGSLSAFPLSQRILTVNGAVAPTLTVRPGEVFRLRVINASPRTYIPFSIDKHSINIAALDGISLATLQTATSTTLAPGNRADLLVRAGAAGTYAIRKGASKEGINGGSDPAAVLAYVSVQGASTSMALPRSLPAPFKSIQPSEITGRRTITFSMMMGQPPMFLINGVSFDENVVNQTVSLNAVEEWTLVNRSMMDHPFHIHVNPFQVVAVNGRALAAPEWRDVVNLPRMMGSVTIRSRFLDFSGLTALHCHITPHEDLGMMAIVRLA